MSIMDMSVSRPLLRWHGGKWRIAPWIVAQFPPHECYVEPFGGGASVLLRKPRAKLDVYNDLDGAVVALFRVLRDAPDELIRRVELMPFARAEFDAAQDLSQGPKDEIDLSLRLLLRSHMGFSNAGACGRGGHQKTGFRARGLRTGTTPPENWRCFPPVLREVAERLRGVVIERRPALDVIAAQDGPSTLFYLDPPYLPETRDAGADYTHEMSETDHDDLLAMLGALQGAVVLSGYASPRYDRALADWHRIERSAFADGARPRTEVLWMNFDPALPLFGGLK
ncbi:DNA adenine methylase [Rhodovulum sulfidophilum]|uniref:DNA adenine methylase n=1 Tax=Rhodovulum sulfidophilum TaxID=35806 RepID=UPI0007B54D19|nr:DNA adenine methylase [Rhodovulum sulfidophilum]ANB35950.1 DNA methyltransferase [Rhodovulum sulfidophilum DSM 1374]ANB39762.1 DNA methyltransferase [Rhodovulum sulfidophilum]MCW2305028.1 DNA adenine methylase [Rhodovulum sulfidophilum]